MINIFLVLNSDFSIPLKSNLIAKNDVMVKRTKITISVVQKFRALSVFRIINRSLKMSLIIMKKPEIDKYVNAPIPIMLINSDFNLFKFE